MKTRFFICLLALTVFCTGLQAQISVATLAELRDAADTSDYLYTGKADITYYDAALHHYFIQDETAAIFLDDYSTLLAPQFIRGAGISSVLGNLHDYDNNAWFLIQADAAGSAPIGITPQVVSITEFNYLGDDLESELVTLENVYFTDADGSTVFETGTNYDLQAAPGGSVVICKTQFYTANYIGAVIPGDPCNVTGLVTESSGTYYITPRDSADFQILQTPANVVFNVDMSETGIIEGDAVYVTGDFAGWTMPGDSLGLMLEDPDGDLIFTRSLTLNEGRAEYKYFLGTGWDGGEWTGGSNRVIYVKGDTSLADVWADTSSSFYVEEPGPLGGGSGTDEDPWLIYTAEHLDSVRYYFPINGYDSRFRLMADIDLGDSPWTDGSGWDPIGNAGAPFTGYFFGNGHEIRNMAIDDDSDAYMGLFGHNRGFITDLLVHDALILRENGRAGILAGVNEDAGSIEHCDVSGEMLDGGTVGKMGGLTSWNQGTIYYCSSDVTITCEGGSLIAGLVAQNPGGILMHSESHGTLNCSGCSYVGGVAGRVWNNTQLSGCFSDMTINAGGSWNVGGVAGSFERSILSTSFYSNFDDDIIAGNTAGGLAGWAYQATVWDCYSVGNVRCEQRAGGLLGFSYNSDVERCYATGEISKCLNNPGGLIGYEYGGSVSDCFWDMELSRIESSAGGRGLNTEDMVSRATYGGWALDVTWHMGEASYPFLSPQTEQATWNLPRGDDGLYQLIVTVDMGDAEGFDPASDNVYISGNFAAWPEPGSSDTYRMTRYDDNSTAWVVKLDVPDGTYDYKFFINSGWDGGEWTGDPNRCMTVHDYTIVNDVWAVLPDTVSSDLVYASSVIGFSSQITDTSMFEGAWHAEQVLGPPDSYPGYDNKNGLVWLSETPDAEREYLELGLPESGYAYGIFVYETYMPGTIDSVSVRSAEDGSWECIWTGNPGYAGPVSRIFPVMFDKTSYPVDAVRLDMNSSAISGSWNETDAVAVALSDTPGSGDDWYVGISAQWQTYKDTINYCGVAAGATDGFDEDHDMVEPPEAPAGVSCYFPHPEWGNVLGDNFTADVKGPNAENYYIWDMEVSTPDTGTVTLSFDLYYTDGMPLFLIDGASGDSSVISGEMLYEFYSDGVSPRSFQITAGTVPDTTPAVLILADEFSGPAVYVSGEELLLGWSIENTFDLDSVFIYLSEDAGTIPGTLIAELGAAYSYTWTLPEREISPYAVLTVMAQAENGDMLYGRSAEPFAIGGTPMRITYNAGWNLVGFPMEPERPTTAALNKSAAAALYGVIYGYANGGYVIPEYLDLAKGYWVGIDETSTGELDGVIQTSAVTADLDAGWNMISDPLITDITTDSLIFIKDGVRKLRQEAVSAGWINQLFGWNKLLGYGNATVLKPWKGYWLSVLTDGVQVEYPLHHITQVSIDKAPAVLPLLSFHAAGPNLNNDLVKLDINAAATNGFDPALDAIAPPASPSSDYLRLYVEHSDVNFILGNRFVTDVRQPATESVYRQWDLKVETSEDHVNLSWTAGTIPDGMQIAADTDGDGVFLDLTDLGSITLHNGDILPVRLGVNIVGVSPDALPETFVLQSNYPNPFNPVTTIDYGLPETADVDLAVYDLNGRRIATLVSERQTAGYHSIRWNGCNDNGTRMGSGMYIYTLRTSETVLSQKMLLMK